MFTGLVETVGTLAAATGGNPRRLTIATSLASEPVRLGDSVAIEGCCLTVVAADARTLAFEAATETLTRTTLGKLNVGAPVNLERALRLGDRLGGHLVTGHVDGVGTVRARAQVGGSLQLTIEAPAELAHLTAARGSITVAGVSLTVASVSGRQFMVGLVPHTVSVTTLGDLKPGDSVNLEADLIARYLERMLTKEIGLTVETLAARGFA